ncbi:MAG: hypothetical protein Q7U98_17980 [Methylicorpusculum sp.]|uniref:hypothetical protein n=1 Tax=Methylicorpusculum sp. TaxID=2713644 RepID=UPI00271FEBD2|nr:hypothetical protein [Methylicorpusculum sp.]MDO8941047.1 hypothetical protein [Methylicorpusculum sp.]MDP2202354.1 hypothetical protein [Methylicorpusculum sp.]
MKTSKFISVFFFAGSLFFTQMASAALFNSNISITGTTTFDTGFSFGPTTGQMTNTIGGTPTTTSLAGSIATGNNPLTGNLTHIGDSYSFGGSGAATDAEFAMGIDSLITITNNSTSLFEIIFQLDYRNFVTSAGSDAFADSEFSVSRDGTEIFFTDLVSDTVNGNTIGGNTASGLGGNLSESGLFQIVLLLNPSQSTTLDSFWTLEGGDFATGNAEFDSLFSFNLISVTDKTTQPPSPVPTPSALALISISLFGFGFSRNRKTHSV